MSNLEVKENLRLRNTLLKVIQNDQDYSDEEMLLFTLVQIDNNEKVAPGKYFVRLTCDNVELDFICTDIWKKPIVSETNFLHWPIDFSQE